MSESEQEIEQLRALALKAIKALQMAPDPKVPPFLQLAWQALPEIDLPGDVTDELGGLLIELERLAVRKPKSVERLM